VKVNIKIKTMKNFLFICTASLFALISCAQPAKKQTKNMTATSSETLPANTAVATLGTGCFWCTEAIFQQLDGVISATSGYAGGHTEKPSYKEVCSGETGHAECIQIVYNTTKLTFDELLEVFWQVHDPTTLNRQGADVGTQYRSVIFYHNDEQKQKAEKYKTELGKSGAYSDPIVTTLEPFTKFYTAENYHQEYYELNKNTNPYCSMVVRPKLEKFEKVFKDKLKKNK
jgi:peptide-methionine (S)-S-oxide reductase